MKKTRSWTLLVLAVALLVSACSGSQTVERLQNPLNRLERELARYPEYAITLQDMREEGTFSSVYWHQYKVMTGEKAADSEDLSYVEKTRPWERVSRKVFDNYQPFLGMVVLSKGPDGKVDKGQHPPGYQYVGNARYGQWRNDGRGSSFWEFYGKFALMSSIIGAFQRPVYRSDWSSYRDHRGRGAPYFGSNREFGTGGSITKRTNPNFFRRAQARQGTRQQRFSDRVRSRSSRSRSSSARGRGGGFGK